MTKIEVGSKEYFPGIERVRFEGKDSKNPFAYRWYDEDRIVAGKKMMDANRGDYQNGWDTDQFSVNLYEMVEALLVIAEAGGFGKGGVNFDAKVRRNSTEFADLFVAHITGIDQFARALLAADAIFRESEYSSMRRQRYASFDGGVGKRFENGELTFEDLRRHVNANGEPHQTSGRQEFFEQMITMFT